MAQVSYKHKFDRARIGMLEGTFNDSGRVRCYQNNANGKKEVWTIGVPASPDNSTEYSIKVGDATARFMTDEDATQEELLNGMLNALRTNPVVGSRYSTRVDGTNLVLTAKNTEFEFLVSSESGFTVNKTQAKVEPDPIPFGRIVARAASEPSSTCKLLSLTTDRILGISMAPYDLERNGVGSAAYTEYPPYSSVDVIDRTASTSGIWMECDSPDIKIDDVVYASTSAGDEGKLSKTTTASFLSLLGMARFESDAIILESGKLAIKVSFNLV